VISELEIKFESAFLKEFACSWVLYTIEKTSGNVSFQLETLSIVYVYLIEHKKLKERYLTLFPYIEWLESRIQQTNCPKVQFYLM
jgi:hypothetical protein